MSSLVKIKPRFDLTTKNRDEVIEQLRTKLAKRVSRAYLFGSFATATHEPHSDIDIILVQESRKNFLERSLEFSDLYEIHPNMDILVYTDRELKNQFHEAVGFWKSVQESLLQII